MRKNTYRNQTKKPVYIRRDFLGHRGSFNLQLFAEDGDDGGGEDAGSGGSEEEGSGDGSKDEGKDKPRTYTDADVDRIVASKRAAWLKEHEKALEDAKEEARKYERMSKEQKEEADRKKAQEEAEKKRYSGRSRRV